MNGDVVETSRMLAREHTAAEQRVIQQRPAIGLWVKSVRARAARPAQTQPVTDRAQRMRNTVVVIQKTWIVNAQYTCILLRLHVVMYAVKIKRKIFKSNILCDNE